ncbi:MAG: endopeptidase La [Phycisphaerales bacterium]|nr:MAG: endopeptidase La [Phycisphaerales bacterium]
MSASQNGDEPNGQSPPTDFKGRIPPETRRPGASDVVPVGGSEKAEPEAMVDVPQELPVLPIRNAVVFPGTIMPLSVSREKSKRLLDAALAGNKLVAAVAQRNAQVEDPALSDLYWVGTACLVLKLLKMPDGTESLVVHGLARIGIETLLRTDPFMVARVNPRHDSTDVSTEIEALMHNARHAAEQIMARTPGIPDEASVVLANISAPGNLADFLAANLSLGLVHKQELLETFDVVERLKKVNATLISQLDVLELSEKLQDQVREQIDTSQRKYYLQQQLKAIQKELGEGDARGVEVERYRKLILDAKMSEAAEKEALRELDRMEKIPQASPEYSIVQDYLNWLTELPWSTATEDSLDVNRAAEILDEDHFGLEKIKKRILEFLAVRKLSPESRGPILCFAGPPGVGKTSLGKSIARAMGRNFIRMSVGGVRDEADIRGHRRTYIGALPGRIIQEIRRSGSNNPVFMLDEVDKIGSDFRGDPSSALLEVLDPQQNYTFQDHYLGVPFDLSHVLFIATANYLDPIPPALRDRMEVIQLPGYAPIEKLQIAVRYLVPRQVAENGLSSEKVSFDEDAIRLVIQGYTMEAGVRNLEREIGTICRGIAAKVARGDIEGETVTHEKVPEYLGPIKFDREIAMQTSVAGVATGLAYTPAGGDIIFIEATRMPGNGNLSLTGQLGEVMRESAHAAFSLVRSRARKFGIDPKELAGTDVHVHVPAGAIPKDGPSAGVGMLTALVSLMTGRPTRADAAMTGEITLRGLVMPVGGIKEKVLAAARAGITTIIMPKRNEKDLHDLPKDAVEKLDFVFVDRIEEVLEAALEKRRRRPADAPAKIRPVPARKTRAGTPSRRGKAAAGRKRKTRTTKRKPASKRTKAKPRRKSRMLTR